MSEKGRNAISYNVFMDPDVEFMDSNGNFPSDYKKISPTGKFLAVLFIVIIFIMLVIVIGDEISKKNEPVELVPATSKTPTIEVIGETIEPTQTTIGTNPIGNYGFVRIFEENLAKTDNTIKPYVIDGYDYAPYNMGITNLKKVMDEIGYEEPKLLVSTYYNGIIDVIGGRNSRNLYRMHKENGTYIYFLYLPKEEKEISVNEDYTILNTIVGVDENGKEFKTYGICFLHGKDIVGEDLPIHVNISYMDGSEDELEVLVTKDYVS